MTSICSNNSCWSDSALELVFGCHPTKTAFHLSFKHKVDTKFLFAFAKVACGNSRKWGKFSRNFRTNTKMMNLLLFRILPLPSDLRKKLFLYLLILDSTARTGQQEQKSWYRTAGAWQLGQDSQDRTDRTGQSEQSVHDNWSRERVQGHGEKSVGQGSQDRTAGEDRRGRTTVAGEPWKKNGRTARTLQNRTVGTG